VTVLNEFTASRLRRGYLKGEFSPLEVVASVFDQIRETDPFNAFITIVPEQALRKAEEAERLYRRGEADSFPLLGIPIAVKDNYDTAGIRTTYGSSMFADNVPTESASCVTDVEAGGGIVVGKTGLHEFAWGMSGVNPHYGAVRNPWDPNRIAGGSSSGSAAALALMQVPLALGSDTAGSVRIPAGFCGVVGFKPSWGRLSRNGLFPLAPTLDHAGVMSRDPQDLRLLLAALPGRNAHGDDARPASTDAGPDLLRGMRVGVVTPFPEVPLEEDITRVFSDAQRTLVELGAELIEAEIPAADDLLRPFSAIQQTEALDAHTTRGLYPDRRLEYGEDVRLRLDAARSVSAQSFAAARRDRDDVRAVIQSRFDTVSVILSPLGAAQPVTIATASEAAYSATLRSRILPYTVPQSLAGAPACAVRAGFDREGLPVGVQFFGRYGDDELVLGVAEAFHLHTRDVQDRWPNGGSTPAV
jgi:aspartyl-tRNA(Asn)/glutamyl-tRNA(Gln) amidotransferase subunit A